MSSSVDSDVRKIPDGDAVKLLTVQNAIDYIGSRLAPKGTALI